MAKRAKAPSGTIWRGDTLHAEFQVRGRRIRGSLDTADTAVARRRVQALKDKAYGQAHGDAEHSLEEAIEGWERSLDRQVTHKKLRPTTRRRYLCSMAQLAPLLEKARCLSDIDLQFVTSIVKARQVGTVTDATIKRDLVALSSLMNFAIDEGWIESNPTLVKLKRMKEGKRKIVMPRVPDIELALGRAADMMARLARAAMATGARLDELTNARLDHIDHARQQLILHGKGDKTRTIDLRVMNGYALITAVPSYIGKPYIFWHGKGERFTNLSSNFRRDVTVATATWARENGVEFHHFRFHDLRHWHAVHFLKDGWGTIYDLQERLGHVSLTTTEHYLSSGHLTADEKHRAKYGRGAPLAEPDPQRRGEAL
jgi:integrase/recombinase XerD